MVIGSKVKIKPDKIHFYEGNRAPFADLTKTGKIYNILGDTAVVMFENIGINVYKDDLCIVD